MSYDSRKDIEDHIKKVDQYMTILNADIKRRALLHDHSKLLPFEKMYWDAYIPELNKVKFGSHEYSEIMRKIRPCWENHYLHNRHHPQHFPDGIKNMTLVDLVEMLCDWKAAMKRGSEKKDMNDMIDMNAARFHIPDTLVQILKNTVEEYLND